MEVFGHPGHLSPRRLKSEAGCRFVKTFRLSGFLSQFSDIVLGLLVLTVVETIVIRVSKSGANNNHSGHLSSGVDDGRWESNYGNYGWVYNLHLSVRTD